MNDVDPIGFISPSEALHRHGLVARKSWGQNFLHSKPTHAAIARATGVGPGDAAIEIGAGLGTLTATLLNSGAIVHAIERDRDLATVLRAELGGHPRFHLHEADAVRFDYGQVCRDENRRLPVVGNLPYQLTGPLLFALLEYDAATGPWIVLVQKEVADRLCEAPGTRRYGGVTAALSRVRAISRVCAVGRGSFVPAPRVDSTVIRLDPRAEPLGEVADPAGYLTLVRTAFQQRRKVLANALTPLGDRTRALTWCSIAGVDPRARPETLGPAEFAALQRAREREPADA